jgi:hypothetical protein
MILSGAAGLPAFSISNDMVAATCLFRSQCEASLTALVSIWPEDQARSANRYSDIVSMAFDTSRVRIRAMVTGYVTIGSVNC